MSNLPVQCGTIITRPRQDRERNHADEIGPAPPPLHLGQAVRSHQPDKPNMREKPFQAHQRIYRIARAQPAFDIGSHQFPAPDTPNTRPHPRQSLRQRGHARNWLERVARRNKEPDLIQPQLAQCPAGQLDMAFMHRVERPAQQAHTHVPPVTPSGQRAAAAPQQGQGRTCPVPITS